MAYSLSAIPGYDEAEANKQALTAQLNTLFEQRDAAAAEFGGIASPQAQQYQQQASALFPQVQAAIQRVQEIVLNSSNTDLASPTSTTGQNQSTPAANAREDGPTQAPTQGGVGAGTSSNAADSRGPDNTPVPNTATTQQVLNVFSTNVNGLIQTQPNQLDQYASYTYSISWYLLTTQQLNAMYEAQKANVAGWQLLMQSGGAPIAGRSPAFPVDYYMDDLEIDTLFPGGGTNMANNATKIRFKVVEPNGISLIENLFKACKAVDSTSKTKNYYAAPYCLVIQFYGYDSNGNLVAPAKGSASGTYGQQAVITKYYPFALTDISFRVANRAVEYEIKGMPIPHYYRGTDRGTVLKNITLTGQTVKQLLIGSPAGATNNTASPGERVTTPAPPGRRLAVSDLPMQQQAAIAAGTDPNAVTPDGMAFGGGGL